MVSDCHKEFNTHTQTHAHARTRSLSEKEKKKNQKQANFTAQWSPLKQLTAQCMRFINTPALPRKG